VPEHLLLVSPPVSCGERNFYPLIRYFHLTRQSGAFLSVTPIAIITEENGIWSFIALEEGVNEDIIQNTTAIHDINSP